MKRILIVVLGVFFIVQAGFCQSKVAVLDASLGAEVHPNASAIVADTINEQFVKSSGYIAIDRSYISSIQAEKQFQLSGEVNDSDIKELGVTFGADYLCIANVSLLGSTYTVSARLIEVSSAEVVAQESHRLQGEIDVLFNIAEVVGREFVGAELTDIAVTAAAEKPQAQPQPQPKPEPAAAAPVPAPKAAPVKWEPMSRISISYLFPSYMGDQGNDTYYGDDFYSVYEQDVYALDQGYDSAANSSWGVDVHIIVPIDFLYLGLGFRYSNQSMSAEFFDSSTYIDYTYSYEILSTIDVSVGAGFIFSPFSNMQIYAGASVGYMVFTLGSDYWDDATVSFWTEDGETASGFAFGGEAGVDFFLGSLCLNLKYSLSYSDDLTGDYTFTDAYETESNGDTSFGVHGFTLGAGFSL